MENICRQRSYHPIEVDPARRGFDLIHEPVPVVVHQVSSVSVPVSRFTLVSAREAALDAKIGSCRALCRLQRIHPRMVGLLDGNRVLPRLHAWVQDGRAFHLRDDRRSGDLGSVGDLGHQEGAQHGEFR